MNAMREKAVIEKQVSIHSPVQNMRYTSKLCSFSITFILHRLTDISWYKMLHITDLSKLCPSGVKTTSFTKELCPLNSFSVLPDLRPWILKKKDKTSVNI